MIEDLVQIRLLGEKKRPENERFRRYLKAHDHSDRRLRRMAEAIEEQIDCTKCANCCRVATTRISERDIERLSRHLGTSPERFVTDYTTTSEDEGLILKRGDTGCVFLEGNLCGVYESRPDTSSRFPMMQGVNRSIVLGRWKCRHRACYSPIVYNALESFKEDAGFTR